MIDTLRMDGGIIQLASLEHGDVLIEVWPVIGGPGGRRVRIPTSNKGAFSQCPV
jgi:hypothetical protein